MTALAWADLFVLSARVGLLLWSAYCLGGGRMLLPVRDAGNKPPDLLEESDDLVVVPVQLVSRSAQVRVRVDELVEVELVH
jgi:hypothetical protein